MCPRDWGTDPTLSSAYSRLLLRLCYAIYVSLYTYTHLGVAGGDAGQTRRHGAGGGVRARRDHGVAMRQQGGGVRVRGEMRMLRLRVMQLRTGRCTLHHHRDGRRPGVDRRPAALAAVVTPAKRLVQVLAHLVLLLLHHVIARRIFQQRSHLQEATRVTLTVIRLESLCLTLLLFVIYQELQMISNFVERVATLSKNVRGEFV